MRKAGHLGRLPHSPELLARLPFAGAHLDKLISANPSATDQVDWSREVAPGAYGDLGNLQYSDCTAAAAGHAETIWQSLNPPARYMTTDEALANYAKTCPTFDPATGAGDNGALCTDVLSIWMTNGIQCGGTISRISAYPTIDPKRHDHVTAAIWAMGVVYAGIGISQADMDNFEQGYAWANLSGPSIGGHCVLLVAADATGVTAVTWGELQKITWDGWDLRADEAYAPLSQRWLAAGRTPQGLDLDQVLAEADAIKA